MGWRAKAAGGFDPEHGIWEGGMGGVGEALGLLTNEPSGTSGGAWLEQIRLGANLAIVVSSLLIAVALVMLYRGKSSLVVVVLAALIVLCALSQVVRLLDDQSPARPLSTGLRVLTATCWIAIAIQLPTVVAHLIKPPPELRARLAVNLGQDQGDPHAVAAARKTKPSARKKRRLKDATHNEPRILSRVRALRELRDILADRETEQCKI
jgi:hypothetical protein